MNIKNNTYDLSDKTFEINRMFDAILSMNQEDINNNKEFIMDLMSSYFLKYYQYDKKNATKFRKALCWIDEALYMKKA